MSCLGLATIFCFICTPPCLRGCLCSTLHKAHPWSCIYIGYPTLYLDYHLHSVFSDDNSVGFKSQTMFLNNVLMFPFLVGTMFDVSTTVNEDEKDICDEAKLSKSPIMNNKTLAGGLKAGNFTYLGRTR